MKNCDRPFAWISAYADRELDDVEMAEARAHLACCPECRSRVDSIVRLGEVLRDGTPVVVSAGLVAGTLERVHAWRAASWHERLHGLVLNPEPVLAGLCGVVATAVLMAVLVGALALPPGRASAPAAVRRVWLQQPVGSDNNPALVGRVIEPPRARVGQDGPIPSVLLDGGDAFYTLSAVVTREGRVARLDVLRGTGDRRMLGALLDAAVATRFEPARYRGLPVAVNMVWLIAHTNVKPKIS